MSMATTTQPQFFVKSPGRGSGRWSMRVIRSEGGGGVDQIVKVVYACMTIGPTWDDG